MLTRLLYSPLGGSVADSAIPFYPERLTEAGEQKKKTGVHLPGGLRGPRKTGPASFLAQVLLSAWMRQLDRDGLAIAEIRIHCNTSTLQFQGLEPTNFCI
jgi:hypothetical protein